MEQITVEHFGFKYGTGCGWIVYIHEYIYIYIYIYFFFPALFGLYLLFCYKTVPLFLVQNSPSIWRRTSKTK